MKLYSYFRSSASYRVRIALNVKELSYDYEPVPLLEGAQHSCAFRALNPMGLVPTLVDGPLVLSQSPAILEWLEETHPMPRLLPQDPAARARVRQIAATIACDIHPLNNLRVLQRLRTDYGQGEEAVSDWVRSWIELGFRAIEAMLERDSHRRGFAFGEGPTLADCFLIPQIYNALRFNMDLSPYPLIGQVHLTCNALEAFRKAHPDNQPDAPRSGT